MNKIFLLFCALAASFLSSAQTIPGGDMETWRSNSSGPDSPVTVQAPAGWYGDDSIIISLGQSFGHTFLGTTDQDWRRNLYREDSIVHSGSHSAKIMTMLQDTLLIPGVLTTGQTHIGISFIPPSISGVSFSGGTAVNVKPKTVSAWVLYFPGKDSTGATGIDSGTLNVQALSLIGGKDSVIGIGTITFGPDTGWRQVTVNINYPLDSTGTIDTMRIAFSSSKPGSALDSSTLYVDDVTMTSIANPDHSGISNISASGSVKVFPNPATGKLYFSTYGVQGLEAVIYSINGQVATQKVLSGYDAVDVSQLPSGLYFYSVFDASGVAVQRGKVSVKN